MVCHECKNVAKKHGKDRYGHQRYRCRACQKTFIRTQPKPLGDMRLEMDQAVMALKMLLEGMSIRATERMTGIHRDTLCDLVATVGKNCRQFLHDKVVGIEVKNVECDELWGFVGCKEKTRQRLGHAENKGDAYCFVAIERETKLVINWHLGKRCTDDTVEFLEDLRYATAGRYQLSTDGFRPYSLCVPHIFNANVDFAQIVKKYGKSDEKDGAALFPGHDNRHRQDQRMRQPGQRDDLHLTR